jgi:exosortase E/protease (VPEID-CTERM system)
VLNAVRITTLILLGGSLTRLALEGFHSVAGWIFFNTTALGLVISSRRAGLFAKAKDEENLPLSINPAAPRLVPLMVTIAAAMITGAGFRGFDFASPLRVILTGTALWLYRGRFKELLWEWSWYAAALGALGFIAWVAIGWQGQSVASNAAFASGLHSLPPVLTFLWIAFRFAGAVVTVPLAEELAFRSYLMRKLVSTEFESVNYKQVTCSAIAVSSILFGLLHQNWIAAIIAGAIYAAATHRRGRLSDAICAHATTNAILALFVVVTGRWSLWN